MRVSLLDGALHVRLDEPLNFYSTIPPGEGVASDILVVHVDRNFRVASIGEAQRRAAREHGLDEALVFFTAADLSRHKTARGAHVEVLVTAGAEPPTCPGGGGAAYESLAGTINVIVEAWEPLAPAGALDLLRTVAEAKAAAAADALLRCPGRPPWRPVGTVSDAVAVLYRRDRSGYTTAGHATRIGADAGLLVYNAVLNSILPTSRSLAERALGVGFEGLLDAFRRVYEEAPHPRLPPREAVAAASRLLDSWLSDPNVASLILAARELDIHASAGSIPGLAPGEYESDSPGIVADEVLGIALAEYLAGTRGVLAMYWVERLKKEGVVREAEVFADDIVSALVGSLVARVLEEAGVR